MKHVRNVLLGVTGVVLLLFVISLFNVFQNDDTKEFAVRNHFNITMTEDEDEKRDEDFIYYEIKNISKTDLYNNEFVFGIYTSDTHNGNYIWFRIAKIAKDDTVTLKMYEDGYYVIDSEKSTSNPETYKISIHPLAPEFDIEDCFRIHSVKVDSEEPEVKEIALSYWSIEKFLLLGLVGISAIATTIAHLKYKKKLLGIKD